MSYPPVEVETPTYNGVRVNHERLLEGIRSLLKQGRSNADICRIIGVPQEVVDRERHKDKRDKK